MHVPEKADVDRFLRGSEVSRVGEGGNRESENGYESRSWHGWCRKRIVISQAEQCLLYFVSSPNGNFGTENSAEI